MSEKPNKRLNEQDRRNLLEFAEKHITCPDQKHVFDKAYAAAKLIVLNVVRAKYPLKDMKVLERYQLCRADNCIRYGGYYDKESTFTFLPDDKDAPLVPSTTGCNERKYEWSKEQRQVLDVYQLARQALQKALSEKKSTYRQLIIGARTFNDITAVWPAAEALRKVVVPEKAEQRALAVLSEAAIAMIQKDNAGAKLKT